MPIRHALIAAIAVLAALGGAEPAQAAQRTFVSTAGSDASASCSLAAPCRGFAKAITLTDSSGEIVVLDSGGYGSVTIGKSVTITSPAGVYAGISVFAGQDGIVVGPGSGKVVLRGLTINGQGGAYGIRVLAGDVHVENVVVSGMGNAGVLVEGGSAVRLSGVTIRLNFKGLQIAPQTDSMAVTVRESEISGNSAYGVTLGTALSGFPVQLTIERTTVTRNNTGLLVSSMPTSPAVLVLTQSVVSENAGAGVQIVSGGTAYVRDTAVTRNGTGLAQESSGVLNACGSNLLVANGVAQSGTINVNAAACLDQVAGGTVTNIATGAGLTGGPITTTGTIGLATTQLLPTSVCAGGQVPQWSGSAWTCAAAGGTGTVTNVATGAGLTGGPITTSGTIGLATTQLLPTVACATGYIPKWNGSAWACAPDANSGGTVTSVTAGNGLTGGTITTSGTIAVDPTSATLTGNFFKQGGNAFGALPGATAVLGTTDNNAIDVRVNGSRVMRYEPTAISPNVIGGSPANTVTAGVRGATIGGGGVPVGFTDPDFDNEAPNRVTDAYGTVGGGYGNRAGDDVGTVTDRPFNTVGGGYLNTASGGYANIGGGHSNIASGILSTSGGGRGNIASGIGAAISGGENNTASGDHATVSGGENNTASNSRSVVGGGLNNTASGSFSVVGGGSNNTASDNGVAGGGINNAASGQNAIVGGGQMNTASGVDSIVGGGFNNTASGYSATVAGGSNGNASGTNAFVGGGAYNIASGGYSSIGGGWINTAIGYASTVPGGSDNVAQGDYSFAAGRRAKANAIGVFALADSSDVDFVALTPNTLVARFTGGYGFWTTTTFTNGCTLSPGGGAWSCTSSRDEKQDFVPVDGRSVLDRVAALPISEWRYKMEVSGARHVGPMAQDFHAAFGLGDSDKGIGVLDASGVALAAIQGLNAKLEATVAEQARKIEAQRAEIVDMRERMAQVESLRGELAAMKDALAAALGARTDVAAASR